MTVTIPSTTAAIGGGVIASLACLFVAQGIYQDTLVLPLPAWALHALMAGAALGCWVFAFATFLAFQLAYPKPAPIDDDVNEDDAPELIGGIWMYRCHGCGGMFRKEHIQLVGEQLCIETCAQPAVRRDQEIAS